MPGIGETGQNPITLFPGGYGFAAIWAQSLRLVYRPILSIITAPPVGHDPRSIGMKASLPDLDQRAYCPHYPRFILPFIFRFYHL